MTKVTRTMSMDEAAELDQIQGNKKLELYKNVIDTWPFQKPETLNTKGEQNDRLEATN